MMSIFTRGRALVFFLKNRLPLIIMIPLCLVLGLAQSCQRAEKRVWILLIDYTVYDPSDMYNELSKFKDSLKDQMKDFDQFKKIRGTKIFRIAVDDHGANKVEHCAQLPEVQGRKDKKIENTLRELKSCFKKVENQIKSRHHKDYKKTLYVEAINRAIEELQNNNTKGGRVTIFGDLAIMDNECSLEKKRCSCDSYTKLNKLKNKILRHKREDKGFSIDVPRQINIPGEESCREERKKVWNFFLLKPFSQKL